MKIKIIGENMDGEKRIIGTCVTDSPNRAIQMYEDDLRDDERLIWEHIDDVSSAAATLGRKGGSSKSDKKAAASRKNGKLGGRPKKADGK